MEKIEKRKNVRNVNFSLSLEAHLARLYMQVVAQCNTPGVGLSMVLRLHQHNIGYTADGFYRSDDPTNSVKALKEGG